MNLNDVCFEDRSLGQKPTQAQLKEIFTQHDTENKGSLNFEQVIQIHQNSKRSKLFEA
jgi:Ca2+-binding EF-hand superfamily protein